ncbi:hypothetical protein pEaSNUABM29_00003 [Erwinia phage pEa_SNUABM_29]|nr:hypothetical protein pEaSNUABM29_00003 [Erwinia phage pEa_SNUABM_29]
MSFTLRWTNPNTAATVVNVYRDTKTISVSALPAPLVTLSNGETSYRDTTAVAGQTYFYLLTVTANGKTIASANQQYTVAVKRGVGPMTFIQGDDRLAYLGQVPYAEQPLFSQMPAAFQAMFPGVFPDRIPLYKFIRNGKVLYTVLPGAFIGSVSWGALYQAGMVYGTDDFGPTGGHGSLVDTKQDAKMIHLNDTYRIRLPRGLTKDSDSPVFAFNDAYAGKDHDAVSALTDNCEYNDLMYAMVNEFPVKQRWPNFYYGSGATLANGGLPNNTTTYPYLNAGILCQEHDTVQDRVLHRGINTVAAAVYPAQFQKILYMPPSQIGRYIPIFELVE